MPELRLTVLVLLGEENPYHVYQSVVRCLGNAASESGDDVLAVRLHDQLSAGTGAGEQEVAEALLKGGVQMEFRLFKQDHRPGRSHQAQHDHREQLADSDPDVIQGDPLAVLSFYHSENRTEGRVFNVQRLRHTEGLQPLLGQLSQREFTILQ